jgi:two-component system chemotaxis response regulator CheY
MDKQKRALIAENDFHTRWRMKRLMEPHICCDVAVTGDEVVAAFDISQEDGTPYDIMLIDLDLPGKTLMEPVADIRQKEETREIARLDRIKFVVISGTDDPREMLSEVLSQCEGFVRRPVEKGEFLGQLHSMGFLQS